MTGAVVLAAGAARRFGSPKQLAPLAGRPLLQHALDALTMVEALDEVVVVLGAEAERVAAAITPGRARLVLCAGWAEGMAASLRAGLAALPGAGRVLVALGDQPGVTPAVVRALLAADGAAVRASYAGTPGHPVLLGPALLPAVAALTGDVGARGVLAAAGVRTVEVGALGAGDDVDTPADLDALSAKDW